MAEKHLEGMWALRNYKIPQIPHLRKCYEKEGGKKGTFITETALVLGLFIGRVERLPPMGIEVNLPLFADNEVISQKIQQDPQNIPSGKKAQEIADLTYSPYASTLVFSNQEA